MKLHKRLILLRMAFIKMPGWTWIMLIFFVTFFLYPADDLKQYYKAVQAWPDPYQGSPLRKGVGGGYYGIFLPWAVPLFLPISFLPQIITTALIRTLSFIALHYLVGQVYWKSAVVCLSFPAVVLIWQGNLDALAALGVLLSGGGAILLLSLKPQAAFLATFAIVRRDGWHHILLPALIVLLSTWLWPEWMYRVTFAGKGFGWWNWSLVPWSFPFAILILLWGIKHRDPIIAAMATPLVTPFILPYSLAPTLALAFRRWPLIGWFLWVVTWIAGLLLLYFK